MVTKSLVEVPFSVHGLIFIESVRGPLSFEIMMVLVVLVNLLILTPTYFLRHMDREKIDFDSVSDSLQDNYIVRTRKFNATF